MPARISRLADFRPYLLSLTASAVSERIAREHQVRFGLRSPEWRVLAVLGDAGPLTQRALVTGTLMDKVAINRACRTLEERGLIAREPHAQDGRSHLLGLTDAGRALHAEIMPLALDMEAQIFSALSEREQAEFTQLLARLRESARTV